MATLRFAGAFTAFMCLFCAAMATVSVRRAQYFVTKTSIVHAAPATTSTTRSVIECLSQCLAHACKATFYGSTQYQCVLVFGSILFKTGTTLMTADSIPTHLAESEILSFIPVVSGCWQIVQVNVDD